MENSFYSMREWCENCERNEFISDHCTNCVTNLIKNNSNIIAEQPEGFAEKKKEDDDD